MTELSNAALLALSGWVDYGNTARFATMTRPEIEAELLLMHRTVKVAEELGEAVNALIGLTGANPRKGSTHTRDQVVDELLDIAITALGAVEHIIEGDGSAMTRLERKIIQVAERAGVVLPVNRFGVTVIRSEPGMLHPECRDGKHRNCDGSSWDNETSRPAPCPCFCHSKAGE